MRTISACDICHRVRNDVRHYFLSRYDPAIRKQRGAGALDLCEECWERVGKPNMKPGRATRCRTSPTA